MTVSFNEFAQALVTPAQRAPIGLDISDVDATALLSNREWAENYYAQWLTLQPVAAPEPVFAPVPLAPVPQVAAVPVEAPSAPASVGPEVLQIPAEATIHAVGPVSAGPEVVELPAGATVHPAALDEQTKPKKSLVRPRNLIIVGAVIVFILIGLVASVALGGINLGAGASVGTVQQKTSTSAATPDPKASVSNSVYAGHFTPAQQKFVDEIRTVTGLPSSAAEVKKSGALAAVERNNVYLTSAKAICPLPFTTAEQTKLVTGFVKGGLTQAVSIKMVAAIHEYCGK
jgi:hypothetical protein